MSSIRVYDIKNRVIFAKNNHLYFIYKYEEGKEIIFVLSKQNDKAKYQSMFDYKEVTEKYSLSFSLTANHLEYQIISARENGSKEVEHGRIPMSSKKKEWFKRTLFTTNGEIIGIENFNGNRSIIYKLNNDFINKIIKQ